MLTPREAFKVGFLARCAEDGLTPDQMLSRVKLAAEMFEKRAFLGKLLDKGVDAGLGAAGGMARLGGLAAVIAPPVLGAMGGYGLAKATDVDDTDVDEIKKRELVEEYQRQAAKMHRQKLVRSYKNDVQRTGRVFI
jgi:hypothetical protein